MLGGLIKEVIGVVDKVVPDTAQKEKLKSEIALKVLELESQRVDASQKVLSAEASGSWLQRNWRPIVMLTIDAILVFYYILDPIIAAIAKVHIAQPIPEQMWTLLTVALGGYIVGRSGEKIAESLKK